MSLRFSAAHSSRIKKTKAPVFKRSSSTPSPYADLPRRKPIQRSKSKAEVQQDEDENLLEDRLDDVGLVQALASDLNLRDVAQAIQYIRGSMFIDIPRAAGMNSTRIAEVLNYRKNLPPIVTMAHVQALLNSPTTTEREIAELIQGGVVRKMVVPGRGSLGEVLILVRDLVEMISASPNLEADLKVRFRDLLHENATAMKFPQARINTLDAKALIHAGFLTHSMMGWTSTDVYSRPGDGSRGTLTSINSISRAASGSMAAVGGEGAVHAAGGSGGGASSAPVGSYSLAIPATGQYLKLLTNARAQLVSLLSKSKYKEAPQDLLRERWDGGVLSDEATSLAKRNRGEFAGVLPGRTRKWKQFYGMSFGWVLEECVGAGMVEVFETGSVGRGIRAL